MKAYNLLFVFIIGWSHLPGGTSGLLAETLDGTVQQDLDVTNLAFWSLACPDQRFMRDILINQNEQDPDFADLVIREKRENGVIVELDSIGKFLLSSQVSPQGLSVSLNCADMEFSVKSSALEKLILVQREVTISWFYFKRFSFLKYNIRRTKGEKTKTCSINFVTGENIINGVIQGSTFKTTLPALDEWETINDRLPYKDICASLPR